MTSSSRLLESTMDVSGNPASFSMRAAWMARCARSPESSRMPIGSVPLAPQLLEDLDRVGDAAAERVDRVHQQHAVVRVDLGVRAEGVELAHARAP